MRRRAGVLGLLFAAIVVTTMTLYPTMTWAGPTTGCVLSGTTNTCTLVETPETAEPGTSQTVSTTLPLGRQNTGFVPIFEPASGVPSSSFPTSTNPSGVTGAVSDYVIIASNQKDITLVSDGFSSSALSDLLRGKSLRQPLAADGTATTVTEPAEGTLDQSVDFFLKDTMGFNDHFIIFSDTSVPEPSPLLLLGSGVAGLVLLRKRRPSSRA